MTQAEQIADLDVLIVYGQRYAINRHTYASAQVAAIVTKYAKEWSDNTRQTLIFNIKEDFENHLVDEYSTVQWREALKALEELKND